MKLYGKWWMLLLVIMLVALPLMTACGDDDDDATATKETPVKKITVTIGILTDKTGPASQALAPVDQALKDMVKYFNDENLITGAEVKVIEYDTQYDPSKDKPGYEWLLDKGADIIFTGVPSSPLTLKSHVDGDEQFMFSLTASEEMYTPPGWVFCSNVSAEVFTMTLLDYLANNDPDFPADRPAKIGAVGSGPYQEAMQEGLKAYIGAHPDKFEWVKGYLVDFATVDFSTEVEGLKDCDYIVPPSTGFSIPNFIGQYLDAGHSTTFLGTDAHMAYLGLLIDGVGWEGFDGMTFAFPYRWWNEDDEVVNLAKQILERYHSESEIGPLKWSGGAYRGGLTQSYGMLTIIAGAVNEFGAEDFNSQAIYDYAVGFSQSFDGNVWDYSETERQSWNSLGIYEASAAEEEILRAQTEWQPCVFTP
ncbi:MAG: ABC transporter substrate-binding protein [Dehalococcoidia bacterium]